MTCYNSLSISAQSGFFHGNSDSYHEKIAMLAGRYFMINFTLYQLNRDSTFPFFVQYGRHDETLVQHNHEDFSELVIVLSGSATHVVGTERFRVGAGDVFVMGQGLAHGYEEVENFRIYNLMYRQEELATDRDDLRMSPGFHSLFIVEPHMNNAGGFRSRLRLAPEELEAVKKQVEAMLEEYGGKARARQTMLMARFVQLVVELSRLYESRTAVAEDTPMGIANVAAYIERHFAEELSVDSLAEIANYSPRHFLRLFAETYGVTPRQYIIERRMNRAAALLKNTDIPVTEVAQMCGFSDSNYFGSAFKAKFGMPPTTFRRRSIEH